MRTIIRAELVLAATGLALLVGSPRAAAQDFNGYDQIKHGDYTAAEREILAELRTFPGDADLLINLAAVYMHQGRTGEARALYSRVMARPNDALDMPDGATVWSHDAAQAGLARISAMQLSAR